MPVKLRVSYLLCLFVFTVSVNAQEISYTLTIHSASCNDSKNGGADVNVVSTFPPYTYVWSFGSTAASVRGLAPGDYTVTITDAAGTDTTVAVEIRAYGGVCAVAAETVFTPNDDGFNDTWYIANIQHHPDNLVLIYNRWGQKVFEHSGAYEPWDGKDLTGIPVPDNAYYYIIYENKNDENTIVKGSVSIIR